LKVGSLVKVGLKRLGELCIVSIATNCVLKPVFVLDRFYIVFDASVL